MNRQEIEDHLKAAGFEKVLRSVFRSDKVDIRLVIDSFVRVEIYDADCKRVLHIIVPTEEIKIRNNTEP